MSDRVIVYDFAEIALYALVALFVAMRSLTAWGAYSSCLGLFILWTFPAMVLDAYLDRERLAVSVLLGAPFYALISPAVHVAIGRRRRPFNNPGSWRSSPFERFCALSGRLLGRLARRLKRQS